MSLTSAWTVACNYLSPVKKSQRPILSKEESTARSKWPDRLSSTPSSSPANARSNTKIQRTTREGRIQKSINSKKRSGWSLNLLPSLWFHSSGEEEKENLDGDTLVNDNQKSYNGDRWSTILVDELDFPQRSTQLNKKSLADKIFQPSDPRVRDWALDEVWVYNKLVMRSREPLLPMTWAADFPSFPDNFFTRNHSAAFINNFATPVFEATVAFNSLIQAGPNCRSQLTTKHPPEPSIARALRAFHKWVLRDGRLRHKKFPRLINIVVARPDETPSAAFDRCSRRLHRRGREWRRKIAELEAEEQEVDSERDDPPQGRKRRREGSCSTAEVARGQRTVKRKKQSRQQENDKVEKEEGTREGRQPPVLYGFVVKYSVLAITSWDPSPLPIPVADDDDIRAQEKNDAGRRRAGKESGNSQSQFKPVRTLGTYNWKTVGHDVWHALAVGVVECKARNELVRMAERGELGEDVVESDPDL